jgi:hypothetical protein
MKLVRRTDDFCPHARPQKRWVWGELHEYYIGHSCNFADAGGNGRHATHAPTVQPCARLAYACHALPDAWTVQPIITGMSCPGHLPLNTGQYASVTKCGYKTGRLNSPGSRAAEIDSLHGTHHSVNDRVNGGARLPNAHKGHALNAFLLTAPSYSPPRYHGGVALHVHRRKRHAASSY